MSASSSIEDEELLLLSTGIPPRGANMRVKPVLATVSFNFMLAVVTALNRGRNKLYGKGMYSNVALTT